MAPTSSSLPAETVATWAIALPSTGLATAWISPASIATVFSMPRRSATGFAPAATFRIPSRIIACASTVAVVVPSPAKSFVLDATSRISCAPVFWSGSSSSISLAIVIPSLTMLGAPYFFSSTTFRPFGPRVMRTASASAFTPSSRARRDSSLNTTSFAIGHR